MKDYVDPVAKSYASENYRCNLEFQLTPQNTVAAVPTYIRRDGDYGQWFPLGSNGTVSNSSILKNRLEDILNCQTLVTESNEASKRLVRADRSTLSLKDMRRFVLRRTTKSVGPEMNGRSQ